VQGVTPLALPSVRDRDQVIERGEGVNVDVVVGSGRGVESVHWVLGFEVQVSPGVSLVMVVVVRVTLMVLLCC